MNIWNLFKDKRWISAVFILFILSAPDLFAARAAVFEEQIVVPVYDNDVVVARKKAFQALQQKIVVLAVKSLVEKPVFDLYQKQIRRRIAVKANRYLLSVRVLSEKNNGIRFSLKLQGRANIGKISEELSHLKIPRKEDPWYNVQIVYHQQEWLPKKELTEALSLYHVKPVSFAVDSGDKPEWDSDSIAMMFNQYTATRVIYYVSMESEEADARNLVLTILNKGNVLEGGILKMVVPGNPDLPDAPVSAKEVSRFLSLFNAVSLKLNTFESSETSVLRIEVQGVASPMSRENFERNFLYNNPAILYSRLAERTSDSASYDLKLRGSEQAFLSWLFNSKRDASVQLIEKDEQKVSLIYLEDHLTEVQDLKPWSPVPEVIQEIETLFPDHAEKMKWLPRWEEVEPNNTGLSPNLLVGDQVISGKISSRIDEDIYVNECQSDTEGLELQWIKIGKTELTPQLRIYDENLNLLASYSMHGNQKKQDIRYKFIDEEVPQKIIIRISDKVGFIPGETGGFKSYRYLLKKLMPKKDLTKESVQE